VGDESFNELEEVVVETSNLVLHVLLEDKSSDFDLRYEAFEN
jgi:hypothetical protein